MEVLLALFGHFFLSPQPRNVVPFTDFWRLCFRCVPDVGRGFSSSRVALSHYYVYRL